MFNKLSTVAQDPKVQETAIRVAGSIVSVIGSMVVANLVATALNRGTELVIEKVVKRTSDSTE